MATKEIRIHKVPADTHKRLRQASMDLGITLEQLCINKLEASIQHQKDLINIEQRLGFLEEVVVETASEAVQSSDHINNLLITILKKLGVQ